MSKAMKFDQGKPPIDLIDQEIILELAKVLGYGAEKYEAHNWKNGLPISRYYSAAQRHLLAFNSGETFDPESGLNHLGHAACNLMFMLYILKHKPTLDDRPIKDKGVLHIDASEFVEAMQETVEKTGISIEKFDPAQYEEIFSAHKQKPIGLRNLATGEVEWY